MSGIFDQVINYAPPSLLKGTVTYKGTWSAATNTPTLINPPDSTTNGFYYVVSAAGTQFSLSFNIGDWIISNGSAWEKVDNTDAVSSVFGRTGAVVGVSTDYSSVGITATAVGASSPSTGAFTTLSATTPLAATSGGTGLSSLGTGVATFLGTPTSANLAAAVTNETGSGSLVFGTSPTITTPVIAQINDANGNETLKLASIASAVNEVTIENAATGNAVHISATGGDASVGLHLAGKGASGYVNVQDSTDATKRLMFNASGGTTNTRTMLSSTQTVDRTLSLPDATDTLVGRATTDTLTNKTLTSPTITGGALNGTLGATTPSSVAATTGTFSSTLGVTGVATLGNGAILGTPASGTVTNLTGTASININGTVGATTPSTIAATTIVGSGSAIFGNTSTPSTSVGGVQINNPFSVGASIFSQAAATGNRWIDFMGSSTTVCSFNNNSGVFSIAASSSGAEINVSGTQRGLFSSTGLAVTGVVSATTDVKAAVYGYFGSAGVAPSASNPGFAFSNPLNVAAASWSAGTATTSLTLVNVYNGNGVVGTVVTNGTATAWNTSSDARLKTNLRDITNSSVIIDALKPRRFDWLTFTKEKDDYGFVAQEAYEVYPKMVTVGGDDPAEKPWGMDASKLIPVLVAELQSLRKRLAALESK